MWGVTEINEACLKHNSLRLSGLRDLFPADAFGGSNEEKAAKSTIRIHWGGEPVVTDLVSSDGAFRKRSWIGEFFSHP